ncbi:MAG: GGDEF domain-containing protein [Sedimenticola sp.]
MTDNNNKPECPVGEKVCGHLDELSDLRSRIDELSELVHTDTLTGLFNFRHFSMALEQEFERTRRTGHPTSLVMLDLDHFKSVNDTWGHEAGNHVLRQTAEIIIQLLRRVDIPCRYGGEEFALIFPGTPLGRAVQAAERIRQALEETPVELEEGPLSVTASLGVNVFQRHSSYSVGQFVKETDELLYRAKREGRNRVCHPDFEAARPKGQVGREEKDALFGG